MLINLPQLSFMMTYLLASNPDCIDYTFECNIDRLVSIVRDGKTAVGRFSITGDFVHSYWVPPIGMSNDLYETLMPESIISVPVYEYRSGMLIPGKLDRHGSFTPEEGARITRFDEYRYGSKCRKIWNLPGFFIPHRAGTPIPPRK